MGKEPACLEKIGLCSALLLASLDFGRSAGEYDVQLLCSRHISAKGSYPHGVKNFFRFPNVLSIKRGTQEAESKSRTSLIHRGFFMYQHWKLSVHRDHVAANPLTIEYTPGKEAVRSQSSRHDQMWSWRTNCRTGFCHWGFCGIGSSCLEPTIISVNLVESHILHIQCSNEIKRQASNIANHQTLSNIAKHQTS